MTMCRKEEATNKTLKAKFDSKNLGDGLIIGSVPVSQRFDYGN